MTNLQEIATNHGWTFDDYVNDCNDRVFMFKKGNGALTLIKEDDHYKGCCAVYIDGHPSLEKPGPLLNVYAGLNTVAYTQKIVEYLKNGIKLNHKSHLGLFDYRYDSQSTKLAIIPYRLKGSGKKYESAFSRLFDRCFNRETNVLDFDQFKSGLMELRKLPPFNHTDYSERDIYINGWKLDHVFHDRCLYFCFSRGNMFVKMGVSTNENPHHSMDDLEACIRKYIEERCVDDFSVTFSSRTNLVVIIRPVFKERHAYGVASHVMFDEADHDYMIEASVRPTDSFDKFYPIPIFFHEKRGLRVYRGDFGDEETFEFGDMLKPFIDMKNLHVDVDTIDQVLKTFQYW